jgi:hypothetical protein
LNICREVDLETRKLAGRGGRVFNHVAATKKGPGRKKSNERYDIRDSIMTNLLTFSTLYPLIYLLLSHQEGRDETRCF